MIFLASHLPLCGHQAAPTQRLVTSCLAPRPLTPPAHPLEPLTLSLYKPQPAQTPTPGPLPHFQGQAGPAGRPVLVPLVPVPSGMPGTELACPKGHYQVRKVGTAAECTLALEEQDRGR